MELIHWRHLDNFHRSGPGGEIACSWHWIILLVTRSLVQFIHSQNSQCHGCYNKWWGRDNIRQLRNRGWKLCHNRVIFHAGWNAIKSVVMMRRDKLPVRCFCEERGRKQPGAQLITRKKLMWTNGLQEFTSDNITRPIPSALSLPALTRIRIPDTVLEHLSNFIRHNKSRS